MTTLLWINPLLFLKGRSRYLELGQDGTRDRNPEIEAVPLALEKTTYTKIALALRRQCELFEFPYDWRRPIALNGEQLHRSIERWADGNPDKRFTLVGHSMGGLVSRAYMAQHPEEAEKRIVRLIAQGTPHLGAPSAAANLLHGNSMMDFAAKLNDGNAPQQLLLNLPGLYQLLPPPQALLPAGRVVADWDLYDAAAWGLEGLRQDLLDGARAFRQLLAGADPQVETVTIAGINLETLIAAQRDAAEGEEGTKSTAGDGTVPLWSAVPPEMKAFFIQHKHRTLPQNRRVIRATIELIHGGQPDLDSEPPPAAEAKGFEAEAAPPEATAEELRARLEQGTATKEDLSQFFFAF